MITGYQLPLHLSSHSIFQLQLCHSILSSHSPFSSCRYVSSRSIFQLQLRTWPAPKHSKRSSLSISESQMRGTSNFFIVCVYCISACACASSACVHEIIPCSIDISHYEVVHHFAVFTPKKKAETKATTSETQPLFGFSCCRCPCIRWDCCSASAIYYIRTATDTATDTQASTGTHKDREDTYTDMHTFTKQKSEKLEP